jgi:uncharacterized membrane protein (DUF373 family)
VFRRFRLGAADAPVVHTNVHAALSRYFEWAQDAIAASLALVVLVITVQGLINLFHLAMIELQPPNVVLPQIMLLLILVELFRTLLYYLREHRVAVGLMIEVAIVSLLRELLIKPPIAAALDALAFSVLLVALGGLMVADRLTSSRALGGEQSHQNGRENGGQHGADPQRDAGDRAG